MMKIDIFNSDKKYNVIYADPPWQYNDKAMNRIGSERHYKTMNFKDICSLPIDKISSDEGFLFLWVTFPLLKEGIQLIEEWGFQYKTIGFNWIKQNKKSDTLFMGGGHYTRSNSEICLIGIKKGTKITKFRKSRSVHSVIISKIQQHSKKPIEIYERIEELFGDVPKVELFARNTKENWDCWGNEV